MALLTVGKGGARRVVTYKALQQIGVTPEQAQANPEQVLSQLAGGAAARVFTDEADANAYLESEAFRQFAGEANLERVVDYTKGSAIYNQPILREGRGEPMEIEEQQRIASLSTSLEKFPAYRGTVYRKMDFDAETLPAFLDQVREGSVFTHKTFASTSTQKQLDTWEDSNVTLTIAANKGRGKAVFNASRHPEEHEVLYDRNAQFRVVSVKKTYKDQLVEDRSQPPKMQMMPIYKTKLINGQPKQIKIGEQRVAVYPKTPQRVVSAAQIDLEEV